MKRTLLVVLALVTTAALGLASPPVAQADDVECTGLMIFAQVDGNVVVPSGETCQFFVSEVRGNVIVRSDATLDFFLSTAHGNIEADGFSEILVNLSTEIFGQGVFGNVIAKNGANPGRARVIDSSVGGSVQFENNAGEVNITNNSVGGLDGGGNIQVVKSETTSTMNILGNRASNIHFYENTATEYNIINNFDVRGNVQVYKNVHSTAGTVQDNTGQSVQCFENMPDGTFVGGPNFAPNTEGQCF